jgi:hypothetical protein
MYFLDKYEFFFEVSIRSGPAQVADFGRQREQAG